MAKILLTGATGFVGSWVAEKCVEENHQVTCLVRRTSNLRWIKDLPVTVLTGSLFDPITYLEALKKSDTVIHVAGVTKALNVSEYYRGNVEATRCLLQAIIDNHIPIRRFLQVSSQAAVGPSPSAEPIEETLDYHPLTDYGKSKMECEKLVLSYKDRLPLTIVRPPVVYGPRDTDVLHFFKNLKKGFDVQVGSVDQYISIVYVEDLARGILQAAFSENTRGRIYFLCEPRAYYWSQFADLTAEIMGVNYRRIRIPYFLAYGVAGLLEGIAKIGKKPTILNRQKMREVKQRYWVVSPRQAINDFDYQTDYPLERGLRVSLDWYRKMGWM
ncbi:MAG: NAD(P)-dependent oxidoreductase [Calditrichia bacterium]